MASQVHLPSSFDDTIIIPNKLIRFIGLDFFKHTLGIENFVRLIIFIVMTATFFGGQLYFLFEAGELDADVLETANAMACFLLATQCVCKLWIMRKKHFIKSFANDIAELWPNNFETQEKEILMNYWLHRLKMVCDYLTKFTVIGLTTYNSLPLFIYFIKLNFDENTAYLLPIQLLYPFKVDSLWKYLAVYIHQNIASGVLFICSFFACDMFLVALTMDVSLLFRLLQRDLANIRVVRHGFPGEESLANLRNIVKKHQKLLKLAESLNEIFGGMMFTVTIFSSIILGIFGFLAIVATATFQRCRYITSSIEILCCVFLIMLPGQVLSDTSSGFADAVYESLWYNSDLRFRKTLLIMMTRSQKACRLRALGYADMNFESFCSICSTAWSYLSLVNQMYQDGSF